MNTTKSALSRPHTLTEEAYAAIKRRIIRLELPPGGTFTESQVAAELSLTKTPVREALGRLEGEGFVEATRCLGYTVSAVTLKDTRDLFALRLLLEGEAAALAAVHAPSAEQLRTLKRAAGAGFESREPESLPRLLEINTEFHATIAAASRNDRLREALERVLDQMERLFNLGLSRRESAADTAREHQELVQAIVQGDAGRARSLAEAHVRASQSMVVDALLASDALLSTNIAATPYVLTHTSAHAQPAG